MAGGFSNGFSDGFGPLLYTRRDRRVTLNKNIKTQKESIMESMIIQGAAASGLYRGQPGTYMSIESIQFDIPLSGVATNSRVTLSGAYGNQVYTFNDNVSPKIRFKPNEDVYITTTNFLSTYGVIINYLVGGDMTSYMQTDGTRNAGYPTFWRFRT
jgi:hypothetical protein